MWIAGAAVIGVIAFVLVLRQGTGYAGLEKRQAYWMEHKPTAYSYKSQVGGWMRPVSIGYPKQVRIAGSAITGAS